MAFRTQLQRAAEPRAVQVLIDALTSNTEATRLRAAEIILAYSRGKPAQAEVVPARDFAAEAAEREAASGSWKS